MQDILTNLAGFSLNIINQKSYKSNLSVFVLSSCFPHHFMQGMLAIRLELRFASHSWKQVLCSGEIPFTDLVEKVEQELFWKVRHFQHSPIFVSSFLPCRSYFCFSRLNAQICRLDQISIRFFIHLKHIGTNGGKQLHTCTGTLLD